MIALEIVQLLKKISVKLDEVSHTQKIIKGEILLLRNEIQELDDNLSRQKEQTQPEKLTVTRTIN